jgi:hypothetical protein
MDILKGLISCKLLILLGTLTKRLNHYDAEQDDILYTPLHLESIT